MSPGGAFIKSIVLWLQLYSITMNAYVHGKAHQSFLLCTAKRTKGANRLEIQLRAIFEISFDLQEAGLKVKEYELLRRNFADSGNFGEALKS